MSFYRFCLESLEADKHVSNTSSLIPLSPELRQLPFFTYRYYTSEKEDSPTWHIISLGHERRWPEREKQKVTSRFILHYCVSGKGLFCGTPVSRGQFFFVRPYEAYEIKSDPKDPIVFYYIGIAGPGTTELMKDAGFTSLPTICDCPFIDRIPALFEEPLYRMHPESDPDYYLMSFYLGLIALHKMQNVQSEDPSREHTYYYYKHAISYIRECLTEGITPSDVAAFLHISPSYLRSIFAKYCRYSPREYLIRERIKYAANLLTFGPHTIAQASAQVGYPDYTLFSKMFRKYIGMSPQEYKKLHHENVPEQGSEQKKETPAEI